MILRPTQCDANTRAAPAHQGRGAGFSLPQDFSPAGAKTPAVGLPESAP